MFRVVPDQLKISEGWVRCGHCAEVFDASAHLSDESVLVTPPAPERVTLAPEEPTRPADLPTRPAGLYPSEAPAPAQGTSSRSSDPSSFFGADSQSLEPSPLDTPFVFRTSEMLRERDSSVYPPDPAAREVQVPLPEPADDPEEAAMRDLSFVRQARRRAFWRRPMVRILLALFSVALAGLLVLQVAYHDRDRLALAQPALRPALQRMCEVLACSIGAPRQIEAIAIESSGFNRLRNDAYRLTFTLRNSAGVQVAVPAMELTITDTQDQPLARRVITPAELATGSETIPAGGEWSRSLGVLIAAPPGARVAGYRLLAFYP